MISTEIKLITLSAVANEKLYTVSIKRPGADYCSDHQLLIVKFRLKLKKASRPIRYDINQVSYDYTVEVINRFKGLHLVDKSA